MIAFAACCLRATRGLCVFFFFFFFLLLPPSYYCDHDTAPVAAGLSFSLIATSASVGSAVLASAHCLVWHLNHDHDVPW